MQTRPEAHVQLAGERPFGGLTPCLADFKVVVHRSLHGALQLLDRPTFEVDLVAQVDHVSGEEPELRVELEGPRVSLVLDHGLIPAFSRNLLTSSRVAFPVTRFGCGP